MKRVLMRGGNAMIEIKLYEETDKEEVIKLVLQCQNDGTRPIVRVDDQPELLCIREKYLESGGCFWVAKDNGNVIGSIGLMNCRNGIGVMKKFFLYPEYRGEPYHLGLKLYAELLLFAKKNHIKKLVLDTPKNTIRAHTFYDRAGFKKIRREDLPVQYDYPYKECDFFLLNIINEAD